MIALDLPPPLWVPAKPAILQAAEPWQARLNADMAASGVPRHVRRAVVAEVARLAGLSGPDARPAIVRATLADIARWGDAPLLASMPGIGGAIAGAVGQTGGPAECSYVSSGRSPVSGGGTVFTISSLSLGAEAADRYIGVGVLLNDGDANGRTFSSVTVAGVSATPLVTESGDAFMQGALLLAAVPTGTSGNVVVTLSGSIPGSGGVYAVNVACYRITGLLDTTPDSTNNDFKSSGSLTLDLATTSAGGIAFAVADNGWSSGGATWTGFSTSKDFTLTSAISPRDFSGVHGTTDGSSISIGYGSSTNRIVGCSAALH